MIFYLINYSCESSYNIFLNKTYYKTNNFNMDYNQFTYYRANPFANQGFMPPRAQVNRHKPDFLTQLPMGQQHLQKIGKKQFSGNAHRSTIQTDSLLKSPQRYPYQNRIALDKGYERNMNTIDIEGATGGTLMSQAVKNKMKARQEIIRRQQQSVLSNSSKLQLLHNGQSFQQQKRRRVAYQQYLRDQQQKQINEKLKYEKKKQEQMSRHITSNKNPQQKIQNNYYQNNRKSKLLDNDMTDLPRYQSIDLSRLQQHQRQMPQLYERKHKKSDVSSSRYDKQREEDKNRYSTAESGKELNYLQLANDRKSLRQQNPTNLSSQSALYMAAKNIIKGQ